MATSRKTQAKAGVPEKRRGQQMGDERSKPSKIGEALEQTLEKLVAQPPPPADPQAEEARAAQQRQQQPQPEPEPVRARGR